MSTEKKDSIEATFTKDGMSDIVFTILDYNYVQIQQGESKIKALRSEARIMARKLLEHGCLKK